MLMALGCCSLEAVVNIEWKENYRFLHFLHSTSDFVRYHTNSIKFSLSNDNNEYWENEKLFNVNIAYSPTPHRS